MTPQEQELIQKLADKMRSNQNNAKDPAAAQLVQEAIASQPDIVYRLTQVALAQEVALKEMKERNDYLQRNAEFYKQESSRSGLSKMFGGDRTPPPPPQPAYRPSAFGGFMQTAAGVAAGMVAGSALSHLFFGGDHMSSPVEDITNNTIIEEPNDATGDQQDASQDQTDTSDSQADTANAGGDTGGSFLDGTDNYTQDYTGGGWNQGTGFDDSNSGFGDSGFDDGFANNDQDDDPSRYGGDDGSFGGDDSDFGGFDDDSSSW
ncbi:DUF2076 domain-containing protein [Enterovibrio sp. ZSDZ35]|uniref:DUF2076 domain-containing protein n=1 Tax=Enterovibrio qingdaonensis TaxID=2899818 RepID=A0ABT5QJV5_9GAMM|nr:DUF2076 family protein [Enterovibrio sp. ZSDZ35]MDD1780948.1 DUF2076 domain-containing protein [Enterovibrio sp. ZSDZ35]